MPLAEPSLPATTSSATEKAANNVLSWRLNAIIVVSVIMVVALCWAYLVSESGNMQSMADMMFGMGPVDWTIAYAGGSGF